MTEMTAISREELENLQERARRLAAEKSYLQLVVSMMQKLATAPGLENTVDGMLQIVLNSIGGTNLVIYYVMYGETFYADAFGKKTKVESIDDPAVRQVFKTGEPVDFEHEFSETRLITPEFTGAGTWVFPLTVGAEIIGVFKIEGILLSVLRELQPYLPIFFKSAALMLKNEMLGETRLKKAYDELAERTAQLEAANKELESFSYSVSHDLRNPLRAIDGFSGIILNEYADKLDDEGKRYFDIVRSNARKMGQLIDDLLAFSRMGRKGMIMSEIDMTETARGAIEDLKVINPDRNIKFDLKELPPALGDRAMIHEVFMNLLGNAVKFTRPRETAVIEVGSIPASSTTPPPPYQGGELNDKNIYFVRDNGVGFDMNFSNKLFGVFQRLHGTEEFEGTGVGLAIVQRIISRHGGTIWGEGKVDEGATFYFSLPRK